MKNCLSIFLATLGILKCLSIEAQTLDSTVQNMEYMKYTNAWLSTGHALGLHALPISKISVAEAFSEYGKGRFVNFFEANQHFSAGAKMQSYRKMSDKLAFHGSMEYDAFRGKNMGGSVFIDPYRYPLDIDENADSTAGKKKLERYHLAGAVSRKLGDSWKIGGKIDYETANYAKLKDMRHTNMLLNLDGNVSGSYSFNNCIEVGVGYDYQRRVESVDFDIYGNTDRQYLSLINFGSFYGNIELHDDQGYTADKTPMYDVVHKASVFANIKLAQNLEWFSQLTYGDRNGYYGIRGTGSIVFTEHQGSQLEYHSAATLKKEETIQHFELRLCHQNVDNFQNIYRRETTAGSNTIIAYYGQTKLMDQKITSASFEYTSLLQMNGLNPRWILKAGGQYHRRQQQVSFYPFFRKQEINQVNFNGSVERNFNFGNDLLSVSYELKYGSGGGIAKLDGLYATPSSSQSMPISKDDYLYREFEYLTTARVINSIGFRFAHLVKANQLAYIGLSLNNTNAFRVTTIGNRYFSTQLSLGYSF